MNPILSQHIYFLGLYLVLPFDPLLSFLLKNSYCNVSAALNFSFRVSLFSSG